MPRTKRLKKVLVRRNRKFQTHSASFKVKDTMPSGIKVSGVEGSLLKIPSAISNVLPRKTVKQLTYTEIFNVTSGASGATGSSSQFALNDLYDPYANGTGHQPYGFDQLQTWYDKYMVLGCEITIDANTIGGASEQLIFFSFADSAASGTLTGLASAQTLEKPMTGALILSPEGNARTSRVTLKVNPWDVEGISKRQYMDNLSQYAAYFTASPSLVPTIHIYNGSPSGASSQVATIVLTIKYTAQFFQAKVITSS